MSAHKRIGRLRTPAGDAARASGRQASGPSDAGEAAAYKPGWPMAILDSLPTEIVLLDARGTIVVVNEAWRSFGRANGLQSPAHGVGTNYIHLCEASRIPEARAAAKGIRAVLDGSLGTFACEYACHSPGEQRWFMMSVTPLHAAPEDARGVVIRHVGINERRRAADELVTLSRRAQRRERMFGGMLCASVDETFAVDRQRRFIYANGAALQAWGIRLDEAVGRAASEVGYPAELGTRLDAQIQRVFRTRHCVTDETGFVSAAGKLAQYEYILSPAFADDGSVDFVVGCSRDITARKRSEDALQASVAEFRTLAAAMPQIVWTAVDGEVTYLNTQWTRYTRSPFGLGRGWMEKVHPDDRSVAQHAVEKCTGKGGDGSVEVRLADANGAYRWWLLRGVSVKDKDGAVTKCIGTFTDVDKLKLAQAEVSQANRHLQRQRTELRTLFDLVPAMVWFKDTKGRVLQVNERAAKAMGLSVDGAIGRHISELYPGSARRYGIEDKRIVRTGRARLGRQEQVPNATGDPMWMQSDKVPYRDETGAVIGIVVMKRDITQRKRYEDALGDLNTTLEARVKERTAQLALAREEADRANKAKSTFLATMSHEIRTPMSGLLGLMELLELTPLDEEQHATLKVARDAGHALKRIIDGILDFAKVEAGSLDLELAPSSIRAVIESLCSLHRPTASAKGVGLQGMVAPEVSRSLRFDAMRLGQILNNLLSNAIKFTDRGNVEIVVSRESRTGARENLRITVRDTGIGISPDQVSRLFQPFAQAGAHIAGEFGGTGLGLFIASRLAERMGGSISLASEPGHGTTIAVHVGFDVGAEELQCGQVPDPARHRHRLSALVAARPVTPSVGQAARAGTLLLVVDDHPINRMVLLRQAATLGYAAEAAADGKEALAKWEGGRFGAVLTDCSMPRMNGLQLAAAIRQREAGSSLRTPIIGCTANAMTQTAQDCLGAGMDDSVTKPVSLEELHAVLDRWLPLACTSAADTWPVHVLGSGREMLDLALLGQIAGGAGEALTEVIADFRDCNDADAAQLRAACARSDLPAAEHFAHRLAGACAMLGAVDLCAASSTVQAAAKAGHRAGLVSAMALFESELQELSGYIACKLAELSTPQEQGASQAAALSCG